MFDIGWSEILVIAVVAIIVVGPKDLPRMLRTFGRMMGQVRRTANEFRRQFDDALRDAERQVDLADTRKELQSIGRIDPLADLRKGIGPIATGAVPAKPSDAKPAAPEPSASGAPQAPRESDAA
jgi:sec-independent protein translocase protein TatB